MCIGIPMQVIEQGEFSALCRGRNGVRQINTLLTGPQPEGAWILNFLGSAREVISAEDARRINDAIDAMEALIQGKEIDVDHYFPDLAKGSERKGG